MPSTELIKEHRVKTDRPLESHPNKIHVEGFASETGLRAEDGWVDMDVKFLVTTDSVNSDSTVFGVTIFPPGSRHDIHRHPNAEETVYLIEGRGIARIGDEQITLGPGDILFSPRNEYHGFWNTSETERAVMVWCYGGAGTLEAAGYFTEAEDLGED